MKCEECDRQVGDNWHARARAHEDGWFQARDNRMWCPEHRPEWVDGWRRRRHEARRRRGVLS